MIAVALLALSLIDASPSLVVRVSGLAGDEGQLQLALYDSKMAWDGQAPPHATMTLAVSLPVSEWSVAALPEGEYGVKVYHDLDGDGALGRTKRGRPTEPYGFSGSRKSLFGPPSWKKARVVVGPASTVIEIELRGAGAEPPTTELEAVDRGTER